MALQQLTLPLILHSASPSLSAIHINRVRSRPRPGGEEEAQEAERPTGDLADTHCLKCGRFQLDGSADTRLVRDNKPRPSAVILQKTCRSCGFVNRSPFVKGGAAAFQNLRKRSRRNPNLKSPVTQMEMEKRTQSVPPSTITQPAQGKNPAAWVSGGSKKSKNRKARTGLQEMLERKRKQDREKLTGTSLASFLEGL